MYWVSCCCSGQDRAGQDRIGQGDVGDLMVLYCLCDFVQVPPVPCCQLQMLRVLLMLLSLPARRSTDSSGFS